MKPLAKSYGDWTVLKIDTDRPAQPNGAKPIYILCKCQCGTIRSVRKAFLVAGQSTSCGCKKGEKIADTRLANRKLEDPTYLSQRERRQLAETPKSTDALANIPYLDRRYVDDEDMRWMRKYRALAMAKGILTKFDPMEIPYEQQL